MSFERYKWMDPRLAIPDVPTAWDARIKKALKSIDTEKSIAFEKNVNFAWMVKSLDQAREKTGIIPKVLDQSLAKWKKQAGWKEILENEKKDTLSKFEISTLMSFAGAFLVLLWIFAVIKNKYLINFSIDTIVGVIGLIVAIWFFMAKYRLLKTVCRPNDFIWMDALIFVLCVLVNLMTEIGSAFSPLFLFGAYFMEKKKLQTILNSVQ